MSKSKTEETPGVVYLPIRGRIYRIEEVSQKAYERAQRSAEKPADDGDGTVVDTAIMYRMLTLEAVTVVENKGDPPGEKLDPDAWLEEKAPVVSRVQAEVRRAHLMALTDDELAQTNSEKEEQDPNG